MKRLAEFIRSVIPADPFQLLFVFGVVCLVAAHGLSWWPSHLSFPGQATGDLKQLVSYFGWLPVYFIIFSGVAGYFVCFWPGKHAVRRIIALVCAPALLGLGLMLSRVLYLSAPPSSVLENTSSVLGHSLRMAEGILWKLPAGFQFTLLGLVLISAFALRVALGISRLPLALSADDDFQSQDSGAWRRVQILIFVLVGPYFLVGILLSFVSIGIPFTVLSRPPAYLQSDWFGRLAMVLEYVVGFGVLLCLVWRQEKESMKRALRLPDPKEMFLAATFAIGIDVLISMGQYLLERAQWAAHNFGRLGPPQLEAYFSLPDPWLFLMLFGAFCEELIFRGLLQTRLIRRYGLYRGIFFVAITWAAYHFFSDFSFLGSTPVNVFEKMGFRIFMCIGLSFVLGWLTLRTGSVLPAALAHGLYNVFSASGLGSTFPGVVLVRVGLWVVLAYALFRFWPVNAGDSPRPALEPQSLDNAV
ncbi:MAG TPA: type II CAAX endopeptidase family protein [Candidatus Acidoferrum sp.]|nr:type II CAAX endopeptidase family protein [Candidatus Acidoferrum sp.]